MNDHIEESIEVAGWRFRQRVPPGAGPHPVVLMLHGWTGDENAMWIFASRLPSGALLLSPRALYDAPGGGYGWHSNKVNAWPWIDDFLPAVEALGNVLTIDNFPAADFSDLSLVGFSQGAALAYSYGLLYPYRVRRLAGLSGFMPDGAQALVRNRPLVDRCIFMAHGIQDELVPVERARSAVELLEMAGAQVTYCEDDVGHKLSRGCFRGLQSFFAGK
jgi:phospholipase/carboxylesterase